MRKSDHHRRIRGPFGTLKELQAEKIRLQRAVIQTEEGIRSDYRNLVDAFTFRNIINAVAEEIIATNLIVSQAYSIIRPLFKRRKKKKKVEGRGSKVKEISD